MQVGSGVVKAANGRVALQQLLPAMLDGRLVLRVYGLGIRVQGVGFRV